MESERIETLRMWHHSSKEHIVKLFLFFLCRAFICLFASGSWPFELHTGICVAVRPIHHPPCLYDAAGRVITEVRCLFTRSLAATVFVKLTGESRTWRWRRCNPRLDASCLTVSMTSSPKNCVKVPFYANFFFYKNNNNVTVAFDWTAQKWEKSIF